ncbi:hypothetical protein SAY86_001957 [Trapa natans]|uniref:DUF7788 domain-containing protein n=1 Tax=Trapa natans TaxID=22666 RepID=A0AAN7R4A0_TRANT|nr:hypothetical protein SAY86_001957 [Trapa natans]
MDCGMNTDFQKVLDQILEVAQKGKLSSDLIVNLVFVFSDMEFDEASTDRPWETDYEVIKRKFREAGYDQIKQFLSIPIPSNLCCRGLIYLSLSDPMTAPNTGTITASLERSLQKISLNGPGGSGGGAARVGRSSSSEDISESQLNNSDATLELNSHVSLPYHWEQCLDLQTGEIYYINWRTGMRAKEDPRLTGDYTEDYYYSDEDEDDSSNCDSGESSSVSSPADFHSPAAAREPPPLAGGGGEKDSVLVVGGCKMCLMYFMVPKQVEDCPKCSGRLVLHFNGSP